MPGICPNCGREITCADRMKEDRCGRASCERKYRKGIPRERELEGEIEELGRQLAEPGVAGKEREELQRHLNRCRNILQLESCPDAKSRRILLKTSPIWVNAQGRDLTPEQREKKYRAGDAWIDTGKFW